LDTHWNCHFDEIHGFLCLKHHEQSSGCFRHVVACFIVAHDSPLLDSLYQFWKNEYGFNRWCHAQHPTNGLMWPTIKPMNWCGRRGCAETRCASTARRCRELAKNWWARKWLRDICRDKSPAWLNQSRDGIAVSIRASHRPASSPAGIGLLSSLASSFFEFIIYGCGLCFIFFISLC